MRDVVVVEFGGLCEDLLGVSMFRSDSPAEVPGRSAELAFTVLSEMPDAVCPSKYCAGSFAKVERVLLR